MKQRRKGWEGKRERKGEKEVKRMETERCCRGRRQERKRKREAEESGVQREREVWEREEEREAGK